MSLLGLEIFAGVGSVSVNGSLDVVEYLGERVEIRGGRRERQDGHASSLDFISVSDTGVESHLADRLLSKESSGAVFVKPAFE